MSELNELRLWKDEAQEALKSYREQENLHIKTMEEMHGVIVMVADSLHQAELALNKYIEVKNDYFKRRK